MAEDHAEHDRDAADEQADATTSSLRREAPSGGRPRGRFWYRVVGGVTLVTFAALALTGTLVWLLPTLPIRAENASLTVRPPTPVTIDASAAGIVCVNGDGAAWSPESTSFVLASCSGTAAEQNETLAIFDAHTGAVRARTTIQAVAIQRAIPPPDGTSWGQNVIRYGQPFWSPDGRRLAVTPSDVGAAGVPALTVYDCASGRVRLELSRADLVPALGGGPPFSALAWSPDGTRLLLVPMGRHPRIQVLGPTSLGS